MVVFNMVVKACPLTNGIVTVDGRKMDFVIHKGQLILSDSSIKPERVQEIKERLKTITMNAYKVSSFNSWLIFGQKPSTNCTGLLLFLSHRKQEKVINKLIRIIDNV